MNLRLFRLCHPLYKGVPNCGAYVTIRPSSLNYRFKCVFFIGIISSNYHRLLDE